jgi:transposase
MCLQVKAVAPVPEQTARVARAAFPKGSLYLRMRDEFGTFFTDQQFADLFPTFGQPAQTPWRLALVTVMQFAEGLSDRQGADAVRARLDWKYALSLDLEDPGFNEDPGFDASVLCEFRTRLLVGSAEARLFELMLTKFQDRGFLKIRGRQRTDSTHVLSFVRGLHRLETLVETMRYALNSLAEADAEWTLARTQPDWFDRYGKRADDYRLPRPQEKRDEFAVAVGSDGYSLLQALWSAQAPASLRRLPAVEALRRVWLQQFRRQEGQVHLRGADDLPPGAVRIVSPYDLEARFSVKRQTRWTGYKVHLTETCDADAPHLLTQVQTTPSTTADCEATPPIQAALAQAGRRPTEHLVDEGYTQASHLVNSRSLHGVEIIGPVARDGSRQAMENKGFDVSCFRLDWEQQRAFCPAGKTSRPWQRTRNARGSTFLLAMFEAADCRVCLHRPDCTHSKGRGRTLYLHPQTEHEALHNGRQQQKTPQFRVRYAARAGIEGTISQGVRAFGLRQCRYLGQSKTHLQNLMTAAALNYCRVFDWLIETPLARTRQSQFARLKHAGLVAA